MDKFDKALGVICLSLLMVSIVCGYLSFSDANRLLLSKIEKLETSLNRRGIKIVEGTVKSPAVIIFVDSREKFLAKVDELGAKTVYKNYFDIYYVFTKDFNIAYALNIARSD